MNPTTAFYLVFAAVDLILAVALYFAWRSHLAAWHASASGWQYVLAALLTTEATTVWFFIAWYTYDAWDVSMDPALPKPSFLVIWGLSFFAFGILLSMSQPLNRLLKRRSESA